MVAALGEIIGIARNHVIDHPTPDTPTSGAVACYYGRGPWMRMER
jgi:hypothetical protein